MGIAGVEYCNNLESAKVFGVFTKNATIGASIDARTNRKILAE